MPIKTTLWKIAETPQLLTETHLVSEKQLEEMIINEPCLLSEEWLLIGKQVQTSYGAIIDLLALAPDGSLILIELKRDRTPREVVAQAIDYASWIEGLAPENLAEIYSRFSSTGNLASAFFDKFNSQLVEDDLNQSHQIIIVAAELDASTERIVTYLNNRDIAINVLFFQVFSNGTEQFISRTWFLDPIETQTAASTTKKQISEPWNGEFYCSFGHSVSRSWADAMKYGFISGGGGAWYSRTLQLLNPGDRIWVNVPGTGYVGVGRVIAKAQPAAEYQLSTKTGKHPALEILKEANYHRDCIDDDEKCEYFVSVKWLDVKSLDNAIQEIGLFGNQNTVCKPKSKKWQTTVERLKLHLPNYNVTDS